MSRLHERSAALDAVRVLGVVAVITGHAIPDDGYRAMLFAWHVPVFFFLSGYLSKTHRDLAGELLARSRSLAWPYVTWLAVIAVPYAIVLLVTTEPDEDWIGPLLGGANANEPFTTFWFVSVLFFTALLFNLVNGSRLLSWVVAVAGLLAGYLFGPELAHSPLAVGSALPCLVFVVLGRELRPLVERVRFRAAAGVTLVVVGEMLVLLRVSEPFNIKFGDYGTPLLAPAVAAAISIGLILIAEAAFDRVSSTIARATTTLALASLTAVLVHPVAQWAARPFDVDPAVLVVLMLIVPWTLGVVLLRSPLSQATNGSPSVRAKRQGEGW